MRAQDLLKGYVKIRIEGFYIEKVINMCRKNNIELVNLDRKSNTTIYTSVCIKDFKPVSKIVKNNKCRLKILRKIGIPFVVKKYRKRKVFFIALLTLCLTIIILSKFVWNIEVIGGDEGLQEAVIEISKEEGLEIGKLKKTVNLNQIINRIRLERADVSWVGIRMCGTNVKLEIVKADTKPEIVNEYESCNIVALKDCVIERISAQNGTIRVKEGDIVKAGSTLIEGVMEGKYTEPQNVHPVGLVIGKVWYKEKARVYRKQVKKNQTGRKEVKYSIKVNNFAINFYKKLSKFEKYDTIGTGKKLKISSDFYLPIEIEKNTNYEFENEEIEYTVDEIKKQAIDEAKLKLGERIGNSGDIINEYINTDENEEYIDVEVTYEVLENVGTEEKIAL
ncbi:MAG: sporulation protein YqfD [Clostridia bacterium]|nr:sporulation protein YqfD [Clostridia bacterium]